VESYESEQVVCGHHVYKSIWTPFIGEELICHQESGNTSNPFTVAVLKPDSSSGMVVSHVIQKISAACSVFFRVGGNNSLYYNRTKTVLERFKAGRPQRAM